MAAVAEAKYDMCPNWDRSALIITRKVSNSMCQHHTIARLPQQEVSIAEKEENLIIASLESLLKLSISTS